MSSQNGIGTTVLLLTILGVGLFGLERVHSMHEGVKSVLEENRNREVYTVQPQVAETTVTNTSGYTITVKTSRLKDETTADFVARHLDAVTAFEAS